MEEVLDPAVIAELRRAQEAFGNPDFMRQLVGLFLAGAPGKMDRIRQALADGDAPAAREAAHALKSNCGMLGAMRMAGACARLEEAASRSDLVAASEAFREADQQLPAVLEALSNLK
jgi:HPt (histidine-containing phosphotransfer) domain-containing protein